MTATKNFQVQNETLARGPRTSTSEKNILIIHERLKEAAALQYGKLLDTSEYGMGVPNQSFQMIWVSAKWVPGFTTDIRKQTVMPCAKD